MAAAIQIARTMIPVDVPFHGSTISCLRDEQDDSRWVVLSRACEAIGMDYSAQLKRLKAEHWAFMALNATKGSDGRLCEMALIDIETFGYWLATISSRRVKDPSVRSKIEIYQKEAKSAVYNHFAGMGSASVELATVAPSNPLEIVLAQSRQLTAVIEAALVAQRAADEAKEVAVAASLVAEHAAQVAHQAEAKADAAMLSLTGDVDFMTIRGYCKLHGYKLADDHFKLAGSQIAKFCKTKAIPINRTQDRKWGVVNAYRMDVLDHWASQTVNKPRAIVAKS